MYVGGKHTYLEIMSMYGSQKHTYLESMGMYVSEKHTYLNMMGMYVYGNHTCRRWNIHTWKAHGYGWFPETYIPGKHGYVCFWETCIPENYRYVCMSGFVVSQLHTFVNPLDESHDLPEVVPRYLSRAQKTPPDAAHTLTLLPCACWLAQNKSAQGRGRSCSSYGTSKTIG